MNRVGYGLVIKTQKVMESLTKPTLIDLVMNITYDQYRRDGRLTIYARTLAALILIIWKP
jgi:hypothetical protein